MSLRFLLLFLFVTTSLYSVGFNFFESESVNKIKSSIDKDPNNANLYVELAQEYAKEAQQSQNVDDLYKSYEAIKTAHSLAPMNIKIIEMNYFLGGDLVRMKSDKKVLDEIAPLYEILKNSNISITPPSFMQAMLLPRTEESVSEGIKLLNKAIRENNKHFQSYAALAEAYIFSEQYDLAIRIAQIGAKIKPDFTEFYMMQARALMSKTYDNIMVESGCIIEYTKENEKIIKLLQKIIQLKPSNIEAKIYLAQMYARIGKNNLAVFLMEQVVKDNKEDQLTMELVRQYTENLQLEKAKKILDTFSPSEDNLKNVKINELYSIAFFEQNWKKVIELYEKKPEKERRFYDYVGYETAKNLESNTTSSYKSLDEIPSSVAINGWRKNIKSYLQLKMSENEFLKSANNSCQRTEALYLLGMNRLQKGDVDDANHFFEEVLKLKIYSFQEYIRSKYYLQTTNKKGI